MAVVIMHAASHTFTASIRYTLLHFISLHFLSLPIPLSVLLFGTHLRKEVARTTKHGVGAFPFPAMMRSRLLLDATCDGCNAGEINRAFYQAVPGSRYLFPSFLLFFYLLSTTVFEKTHVRSNGSGSTRLVWSVKVYTFDDGRCNQYIPEFLQTMTCVFNALCLKHSYMMCSRLPNVIVIGSLGETYCRWTACWFAT